jgi:hypothetical protein
MDLTVAAVNATVVVAVSVILGWVGKRRIDALERPINERFAEMRERTDGVEARSTASARISPPWPSLSGPAPERRPTAGNS